MPYLKQQDKAYYESLITSISKHAITSPGELNYLVTELVKQAMKDKVVNYTLLNGITGALESAKLEFYARIVRPYEDKKIQTNGDVYNE